MVIISPKRRHITFKFLSHLGKSVAMSNVTTTYARLTSVTATGGGGETRLLSAGTAGTDYNGGVSFAANTFSKGDIIRIIAWGKWTNTGTGVVQGEVRLYFNPTGALAGAISDTGAAVGLSNVYA
jgi:hypothetical protein